MAGKGDIVEQALKLIAGGGAESTATAAARAAENAALLKDARRLGFDTNDVGALKETKALTDFHSKFMGDVRTRAQELTEVRRQLQEQGAFPMEVGTRFTTAHARENGLGPHTVTGYYVNPKDPHNSYGYRVRQDLGNGDWQEYDMMIRDPKLEERHGPEKWKELQQGWVPMTGPRVVKEGGGEVDPYANEVASAKAAMAEKQYDDQSWGDWAGDAVGNALNTAKAILPTALGGRGEVGITDIARGAYEGAKDAVTFPGDVISGKQPLYDESGRPLESAVGRSFNTVGAVGGASSLVPVPDNSLRVFGGIKSKTADRNALTTAQIMESQGATPEQVYGSTGWSRGTDEQWRYEIPDMGTTVDPSKFNLDLSSSTIPSGMKATLGEYINHPKLFEAYPEFKNMPVKAYYDTSDTWGYYMPRQDNTGFIADPYIGLNLNYLGSKELQRSTLLHEIQHAIQQKEGFMRGANKGMFAPDTVPNPKIKIYEDAVQNDPEMQEFQALSHNSDFHKELDEANKFYKKAFDPRFKALSAEETRTGKDLSGEWFKLSEEYEKTVHDMFPLMKRRAALSKSLTDRGVPVMRPHKPFLEPSQAYEQTAGEVEARNVQRRMDKTEEELKDSYPPSTEDFLRNEQLIDWNNTSWRKGYAGRGRVAKGIADEVVGLAKRILGSEPEVRKVTGAELLKKTEGLSEDPFGFSKFSKPLSEMEYTVKMLPREKYKSLDPYDLVKQNATIVGHISDRTAAGREVSNIGGVDLTEPLKQRGGADYQRTTPYAWANRPGAGKTLNKKLNEAAKGGDPVYTTPVFMGASSANSSHMVGAPLIRMIPNLPISQADKLAFDAMMSERFPGWPGINNTEAAEKFMYSGNVPGSAISRFIDYASAKKWKGAGFPDTSEIMFSAMDPRLVGVPQGSTGMGFKEFDPGKEVIIKGPESHPDYPASIPGKEYAGGFKYQVPQSLMMSDWWKSLNPELRLPKNATKAQHTLMTQIPTQKATPEWADRILEHWEKNPIPWGYADGGEVDEDVTDALRVAKDVGGATGENPQVFLTDAQGRQYDAQGKPIQPVATQEQSNSAATQAAPTPEQVGRRAAEDPATFDAMMQKYAVPDRDVAEYEALQTAVRQQPQQVQQMTHVGAPPMRDIKVDMPLFGGEYNAGQAPYNVAEPLATTAQTAYDLKTAPLYMTPMTAPIGAGLDVAEGVATGDPLQASMAALGAPGKMTKAAVIGLSNYAMDPAQAEAGPARWFSKAMEVAREIPMNKMTGEQALAMLRKGTSPEELKWTGAEKFLSSRPQVSKSELVDYLNNNRIQVNEVTLGGDKPWDEMDVVVDPDIMAEFQPKIDEYSEEVRQLRDQQKAMDSSSQSATYDDRLKISNAVAYAQQQLWFAKDAARKKQIERMGGLSNKPKYQSYSTQGGEGYRENLYTLGTTKKPKVEKRDGLWSLINDKGDVIRTPDGKPYVYWSEDSANSAAKSLYREGGQYKSSHWDDPDVLFHTRSQTLSYDPPGSNRPYRVHNVDETQSDWGQDARKYGLIDTSRQWRQEYEDFVRDAARKWVDERAQKAFDAAPMAYDNDIEKAKEFARIVSRQRGITNIANDLGLTDQYEFLYKGVQKLQDGIKPAPYIGSTEGWTDRSIKQELDKALDSDADYFSWSPGEVHADRYDLSRHIGSVMYDPYYEHFTAFDPNGKRVVSEGISDTQKLDNYVGKELGDKIRSMNEERKSNFYDGITIEENADGNYAVLRHGKPTMMSGGYGDWFHTKSEAAEFVDKSFGEFLKENPIQLSGLDLKTGGEGMKGYYDKVYLKRVQDVIKKATGEKPEIEVIEVQTADGPRKQLGIKLTDEMREKARFSDFNRGGTVTAPHSYDNDQTVSNALALTREY